MPSTLGISLGALFFLLIPGLAGLKTFLRTYVRLDDLSRVDKIALAGILGGATLGLVLFSLNSDCWMTRLPELAKNFPALDLTRWGTDGYWCNGETTVKPETIQSLPIVILIGMVSTQSIIASIGGGLAGWYLNRIEDGPSRESKYIEQPWEFVSKNTLREEQSATVITVEGEEIKGTVQRLGTPTEDYDILLASPRKVLRNEKDEIIRHRDLGDYSYHHYQDISQVRMNLEEDYDAKGPEKTRTESRSPVEEDQEPDSEQVDEGIDFEMEESANGETEEVQVD